VNVFGTDTIVSYVSTIPKGSNLEKRIFSFLRGKLVAVEFVYLPDSLTMQVFRKRIAVPLIRQYGLENALVFEDLDRTKENRGYLCLNKNDAALAVYGHFKGVGDENLDWVRVKIYKRKYFDFKNQRKFTGCWKGAAKLMAHM